MSVTIVNTLNDDAPMEIVLTDDDHKNNVISRSFIDKDDNCTITLEVNFENEGFLKITDKEDKKNPKYHYVANGEPLYIIGKMIDLKKTKEFNELCKNNEKNIGENIISYLNQLEWSMALSEDFLNPKTTLASRFYDLELNEDSKNFWIENRSKIFGNKENIKTSNVIVPALKRSYNTKEEFVKEYLKTFTTHIDEMMSKLKEKYEVNFDSHQEQITKIVNEIEEIMLSSEFHYKYIDIRENIIDDFEENFSPVFENDLVFVLGLWKKLLDTQDYHNRENSLAVIKKLKVGTTTVEDYEKINWEKRMQMLTVYITNAMFSGFNKEFRDSKCSELVDAKYDLLKNIGKTIESEMKAAIEKIANSNKSLSQDEKKQHNKDFYYIQKDIDAVFNTYLTLHKNRDPTVHDFSEKMLEYSQKYWYNIHENNKQAISEIAKNIWTNPTYVSDLMAMLGAGKPQTEDTDRHSFDSIITIYDPKPTIVIDQSKHIDTNEDVIVNKIDQDVRSESNDNKTVKLNEDESDQDVLSQLNKSSKVIMHESPKNELNVSESSNKEIINKSPKIELDVNESTSNKIELV